MKMNINQLKRAARKIAVREHRVEAAIRFLGKRRDITPEAKEAAMNMLFKRAGLVDQAKGELRVELARRRVGMPGIRDARPLKIQRLSPAS